MKPVTINTAVRSIVVAFLFLGATHSHADYFPFRVAFEDVPGVEQITAGNVSQGIEILETALDKGDSDRGFVLATLCGAYVLESSLEEAQKACTEAVEISPGETAYNNRGVLRAFSGDFDGARRDFDRARPKDMTAYLEWLEARDIGLIANGNSALLEEVVAKHSPVDVKSSVAMSTGAEIEPISD